MQFGYFDDANKEYVITTPRTPYPWINYLGSQEFFSLISNTAGGYSFYKDAKLRRITRFRYNNVPLDLGGGRYYYINDGGDICLRAGLRQRLNSMLMNAVTAVATPRLRAHAVASRPKLPSSSR